MLVYSYFYLCSIFRPLSHLSVHLHFVLSLFSVCLFLSLAITEFIQIQEWKKPNKAHGGCEQRPTEPARTWPEPDPQKITKMQSTWTGRSWMESWGQLDLTRAARWEWDLNPNRLEEIRTLPERDLRIITPNSKCRRPERTRTGRNPRTIYLKNNSLNPTWNRTGTPCLRLICCLSHKG